MNFKLEIHEPMELSLSLCEDFMLGDQLLDVGTSPRVRDLVRVAMGVYAADRRIPRERDKVWQGLGRSVSMTIEVADSDFWGDTQIAEMVKRILWHLSGDVWEISFCESDQVDSKHQEELDLGMPEIPICLYSSGLDSAAGLATLLEENPQPIATVTALHNDSLRGRVDRHCQVFEQHFGVSIHRFFDRTMLRNAPRKQERSQRCRGILFCSLGAAVADLIKSSEILVLESGVGALNVPPMSGMTISARSTRGASPSFLKMMSDLASAAAGRPITYRLPFSGMTKAQMTRSLSKEPLTDVAYTSVSCSRYPYRPKFRSEREHGDGLQCGYCMACLLRRQAMLAAGLDEPATTYGTDFFGRPEIVNSIDEEKVQDLRAILMQISDFSFLDGPGAPIPDRILRAVQGTGILPKGEDLAPWMAVLKEYREEWLKILLRGRLRGLKWTEYVRLA